MDQRLRNFYLEASVKNAAPGQLVVMLYDALVQNAERAETEIAASANAVDRTQAAHAVSRCIDIMAELKSSLKYDVDPVLCGRLSDLYCFFIRELSEALEKWLPEKIHAILPLLRNLREAWTKAQQITSRVSAQTHAVAA
jgi:flagellar protein FliS